MVPYILVFAVSIFFAYVAFNAVAEKVKSIIFSILAIIIPSLLSAYRDLTVGIDVEVYGEYIYENTAGINSISQLVTQGVLSEVEIGYVFVNFICHLLGGNISTLFFLEQFFALSFCMSTCIKLRDRLSPIHLFSLYLFYYFCISMCHLRQMLAVAIVLWGYTYLIDKKKVKYAVSIIVATLFHHSAIVLLTLIPIGAYISDKKLISQKVILIIILLGSTIVYLFPSFVGIMVEYGILNSKYERYADMEGYNVHKIDLIIVFILYFFGKIPSRNYYSLNLIKILSITIFFILLCGIYNDVAQRIGYYLIFYLFINILFLLEKQDVKSGKNLKLALVGLIFIQFLYISLTVGYAGVVPYTSKILGIQ